MPDDRADLVRVLQRAQALGYVGPGDVQPHIDHALGFAAAASEPPTAAVDLGSGGGIPGLVLAHAWPESRWVLVEASVRRAELLRDAVRTLGVTDRVTVEARRAEEVGRDPLHRGRADLVVARAFGPPAVVAECAAPLLRVGGALVVSEPPDRPDRWPEGSLAALGLAVEARTGGFVRLRQRSRCPQRFPRRVGIPAKRPLF